MWNKNKELGTDKFTKDYILWIDNEDKVIKYLESVGYNIQRNGDTDIHDFIILNSKGKPVNVELKTRRCTKDKYEDTLIWANKLAEAWKKYYSEGEETLFFFSYTDWLFLINPLEYIPRRDYKLQRWDRWIDNPKGWLYYDTKDLKKVF